MQKEQIIKYAKIGLFIGGSYLAFRFIRKQMRLRGVTDKFGDFGTITDNNKGNTGGVSLPIDQQGLQWSPRSSAEALKDAMEVWNGTDENKLWRTLDALDSAKLKLVRTYFNTYFGNGETLFEWFDGDLSGRDLSKAKGYFN